jgi:hypothetical protein
VPLSIPAKRQAASGSIISSGFALDAGNKLTDGDFSSTPNRV